jgi:lipopolysaccharide/colanic/teichoic acid biosynthesis glycosyltransferase
MLFLYGLPGAFMKSIIRHHSRVGVLAAAVATLVVFATSIVVTSPRKRLIPQLSLVKDSPRAVNRPTQNWRLYFLMKRALDIFVSALGIAFLSPLMLAIAAAIRLDSPGPAIFKQTRVGARVRVRNGKRAWEASAFTIYKFRTMANGADSKRHEAFVTALINGDEQKLEEIQGTRLEGADKYKIKNDKRVTRLGKFLRKTSLDELPQLFNVLKGDMSLVGPRPAIPYEVDAYKPHHLRRLEAQQGITGWWQAVGRSSVDFETMVDLDTYYIDHQSFWLDLKILIMTPISVIKGKGAS